ncbi:GNAT family N-acetyltransferase [Streptomyces sp. NRRL S-920]|uniref:GNAT family N-acetyltransferase n=1 Tax=Streptomyces sp. NRRL S-920 TaxID=1463921 RepID=UPI0004CA626E|nr:GNAT family N-acetyltransferase [Streptomyces sp. NRRL S-920]
MSTHPMAGPPSAIRLAQYTHADVAEILGDGDDPFGVAETGLAWLSKEEHFGIRHEGRLVAHAGLRRLPLTVGGTALEVVGVGGVAVAPDVRGRGLARSVVAAALSHARTLGPRHALLFCRPPLVVLYERLGWRPIDEDAQWPAGPVRLRSLPM